MYKIIIVDDEMQAVNSIVEGMNWESLSIDTVLTAYNMKQAVELFEVHQIDMMLCDIEMPKGNGIDLLRWVRANKGDVECIFLTCHADFSYAKEAISLGSTDYLLKPIPFKELSQTIAKAIKKIEQKREASQGKAYGILLQENMKRMIEQFHHELVQGTIGHDYESLKREASLRKIEIDFESVYYTVLFNIQKYGYQMVHWEKEIRYFSLKNIIEEIFAADRRSIIVLSPREDCLYVMLQHTDQTSPNTLDKNQLQSLCERAIREANLFLGSELYAYISTTVTIDGIRTTYLSLEDLKDQNVTLEKAVTFSEEQKKYNETYISPNLTVWKLLLAEGDISRIEEELSAYLSRSVKKGYVNSKFLEYFSQEFLQLLYTYLDDKKVTVKETFQEDRIKQYYLKAVKSVNECMILSVEMAKEVIRTVNDAEQKMSRVEKAILFIQNNLDQEITRETVANHLYLNPDYLNKLFKKEMDITISDFIFSERMLFAQRLLLTTNLSVKHVAIRVGYTNFSHFAKMFQRFSGVTPKKYKKSMSR